MQIRDIMTAPAVTIDPDNTIMEAINMITEKNIGALPVCKDGEVKGIITDRDIITRCVSKGMDLYHNRVSDYMSRDVIKVQPSDTTANASMIMSRQKVRRLPVVDERKIVGMLSLGDLASKAPQDSEISKALTEISKPGGRTARI